MIYLMAKVENMIIVVILLSSLFDFHYFLLHSDEANDAPAIRMGARQARIRPQARDVGAHKQARTRTRTGTGTHIRTHTCRQSAEARARQHASDSALGSPRGVVLRRVH